MLAEHYKLNALIFGIGYLLCMAALKVPLVLPIPAHWMNRLQTWVAIPLILTFGIVQIDVGKLDPKPSTTRHRVPRVD